MTRKNVAAMVSVGGFALLALLAGCGGSHGVGGSPTGGTTSGTRSAGQVRIHIVWPAPVSTRLIPSLSNSIRIVITDAGQTLAEQVVPRPTGGVGVSDVAFDSLSPGDVVITATAYPSSDGTGTAQATGSVPVTVVSDQVVPASITMGTTIDHLELNGSAPLYAYTGRTSNAYTVTARDAAGNAVLFPAGTLTWKGDSSGAITVATSGQITGNTLGSGTVTVTDTESGKTGSATVTVRPATKYLIPTGYTIQEIPLPPAYLQTGTGFASEGFGLNENGQIAGMFIVSGGGTLLHSFFWDGTATQEITVPGTTQSRAIGVNNRGQVAGYGDTAGFGVNYVWTATGGPSVIPTYQPGPTNSQGQTAYGISDSGLVVGTSSVIFSPGVGWPVSASGTISSPVPLGSLFTTSIYSGCVNSSDTVAGRYVVSSTQYTAAIAQNGTVTQLPSYATISQTGAATAINDDEVVVGYANYPFSNILSSASVALRWSNHTTVASLGTLSGWSGSAAIDINNGGLIVGECGNITTSLPNMGSLTAEAFIYGRTTPDSAETMVDLSMLLPAGSGYTLMHANAINDSGQIVGIARRSGYFHAVLLTPK